MRKLNIAAAVVVLGMAALGCGKAHITISGAKSAISMQTANGGFVVASPSYQFIGDSYESAYQIDFSVSMGSDRTVLSTHPNESQTDSASQQIGSNIYAVRVECISGLPNCSEFSALFNYGVLGNPVLNQSADLYQVDLATGAVTKVAEIMNAGYGSIDTATQALLEKYSNAQP